MKMPKLDNYQSKTRFSLLLLVCLLLVILVGWPQLTSNSLTQNIDQQSHQYLDETLVKAGTAFVIARALNAAISVLQSFTISPFIGSLSLGEILDPINDLIERFSWVMLAVTVAIGVQKLLLEIGVSIDLSWLLIVALLLLLASVWLRQEQSYRLRVLAYRVLLLCLLVRFAIPLACMVESSVSAHFLADKQTTAMNSMKASQAQIAELAEAENLISAPKENLQKLQESSQNLVAQVITLITLFLFETILFPLLLLWGLLKILRFVILLPPAPAVVVSENQPRIF